MFDVCDCSKRPVFGREGYARERRLSGAPPERYYIRRPFTHYPGEVREPGDPNRYRRRPGTPLERHRRLFPKTPKPPKYRPRSPRMPINPMRVPRVPATIPSRALPLTRFGRRMFRRLLPRYVDLLLQIMEMQIVVAPRDAGYNFEGMGFTHLWGKVDNCGFLTEWVKFNSSGCTPNADVYECLGGQALSGAYVAYGSPVPIASDIRALYLTRTNSFGRHTLQSHYCRAPGVEGTVEFLPARDGQLGSPLEPYSPWPRISARWLPIQWPSTPPLPVPYFLIPEIVADPLEPQSAPMPYPENSMLPPPRLPPNQVPAFEIVIEPAGVTRAGPSRHVRRPPRRSKEREAKKVIGINNAGKLGVAIGMLTESLDFLNVVWKSLPYAIRREHMGANPFEKIGVILQNLESVAPGTLFANWLSNQLEDAALGRLGRIGAKASRKAGKGFRGSVGLTAGPWDSAPSPMAEWVPEFESFIGDNSVF